MQVRIRNGVVIQTVEYGRVPIQLGFVDTDAKVECLYKAIPPKRNDGVWGFAPPDPPTDEELRIAAMNDLRIMRDFKLRDSDWTQLPRSPVDQDAWAEYRQKLRDLPATVVDPRNFEWPEEPTK